MIRGKKTVNDSFKKSDYKENMIAKEYSFREGFLIFKMQAKCTYLQPIGKDSQKKRC